MAGDFPDSWQLKPLETCMDAIIDYRGKTPRKTTYGIPLITAKVVKNGRIDTPNEFIDPREYDDWMRRGLPKVGDVLVTTEAPLGEVAQLRDAKVALAQRLVALRGRVGEVDNTFLKFLLQSDYVQDQLGARSTGTTVVGIKQSELRQVLLPIPEFAEQRAIACILGALDDKIDLNRRMNRTLEAMARALFQSWFVDFDPVRAKAAGQAPAGLKPEIAALFPDRLVEVEGREVPEGWKLTTLGDVTAKHGGLIQTGPFGSQLHASDYVEAGIPTIMPKDISARRVRTEKIAYIDEADAARLGRHRVLPGDIVYSRRGDVERHALIGKREQGWLCGTGCMLVRPGAEWPSPLFMSLHLDRPAIKEWITQHAIGATMPNLNTSVLGQVPILEPSHTVLKAFAELAAPLDEKNADNDRQSRTLAALRDTLLPQLISGALRVADAERIVGRCL